MNSAGSKTILDGHSDIALLSPHGAPAVLDQVVFLSIFRSISNSEDSVGEKDTTALGSHDARFVLMEVSTVSSDGDGDWALGESGLELGGGEALDVVVGVDLDEAFTLVLTFLGVSKIWI